MDQPSTLQAQKRNFVGSLEHDNSACDGLKDAQSKPVVKANNIVWDCPSRGCNDFWGLPFLHTGLFTQVWLLLTRFPMGMTAPQGASGIVSSDPGEPRRGPGPGPGPFQTTVPGIECPPRSLPHTVLPGKGLENARTCSMFLLPHQPLLPRLPFLTASLASLAKGSSCCQ